MKIITDNAAIKKYCDVADIDCIYYDYINVPTTRFYKLLTLKSRINNVMKEVGVIEADSLYLLDNSFDISAFYLAKEWSRKGGVYFCVLGRKFRAYTEKEYLSAGFLARACLRSLFRVFLGLDLSFLEVYDNPVWGVDDKFLKKNGIMSFAPDKNLREMQLDAMRKNQVKLGEYDNLVSTDGDLSAVLDVDSLLKIHEDLLELPCKFAVKYHPRVLASQKLQDYEMLFQNCDEFPDYIPAELLFNNVRNNVISIFSVSLISASQLEHLRAISLLELVKWKDQSYKEEIRSWLIEESKNKIIFVRTFDELVKLLETS